MLARVSGGLLTRPRSRWVVALPVAAALVYLAVLASGLPRILDQVYWGSDAVTAPLMAENLARGVGAPLFLAADNWATWILFDLATRPIPGHEVAWALGPLVVSLAGVGLMGATVRRVSGRTGPALVCVAIAACAAPMALDTILPQFRAPTWFADAALGAVLGYAATASKLTPRRAALTAACGVLVGLQAVSDPLLQITGIAPFVATGVIAAVRWRREARQVLAAVLLAAAPAVVAYAALGGVLSAWNVRTLHNVRPALAAPGRMLQNARNAWVNLDQLVDGPYQVPPDPGPTPPAALRGLLVVTALALPAFLLGRAEPGEPHPGQEPAARWLLTVYWTLSGAAALGAFVFTDVPIGASTGRYLVPVFYAAAALAALAASRSPRALSLASVGAAAFCTLGTIGVRAYPVNPAPRPAQLMAALQRAGLRHGYADYWAANAITWRSGGAVAVRDVRQSCDGATRPAQLCPHVFNTAAGWYTPEPGPSFVVWAPGDLWDPMPPDGSYGPPDLTFTVGADRIYVYPYDVASNFGRGSP